MSVTKTNFVSQRNKHTIFFWQAKYNLRYGKGNIFYSFPTLEIYNFTLSSAYI